MTALLSWLNSATIVIAGVTVSWSELLGDLTGIACVVLVARQHIWNWPLGLLNNVFWALLFWRAKLYSDSALQGVFFALGCYGWWRWHHKRRGSVLSVRRIRGSEALTLVSLVVVVTAAVAAWLTYKTDSPAPLADAAVLSLSLAATWGQAQKLLESWWIWIAVDVISVPLYASRALYPTAGLYMVFGLLCVVGLRGWSRSLRAQEAASCSTRPTQGTITWCARRRTRSSGSRWSSWPPASRASRSATELRGCARSTLGSRT
jgi:nicotinamide mononucleotide transporter